MKITTKKLENSKVEVTCELEEKAWKEYQEKAFTKLASKLKLKGFREGKVPVEMAKKHISQGEIMNEGVNEALQPTFLEMLQQEKLEPFARPDVNVTKISDTELTLVFKIVLAPEVKLGEYKNLGFKEEKVEVTDKEVEEAVAKLVAQQASLVLSEEPAKKGDTVVIDFVGSVDGKEFEGGKAENFSLELGSGQFVPGFEDQLIGAKAEDKVDVNVTFPEQYVKELAGKKALFKVTVHEVKTKVIPELNEELVKELNIPNVTTVEQLKENQKAQLLTSKTQQAAQVLYGKIVEKLVENSKVDIAKEIIDEEVKSAKENMVNRMAQQGLTLEQYLQITGVKPEDFEANLAKDAEKNLKSFLVLNQISKTEKITVTDEDVEFEMAKIAEQYSMEIAKVKEILGKDINRFKADIRERRIHDFVVANNVAK